jgi:hypothetical protein
MNKENNNIKIKKGIKNIDVLKNKTKGTDYKSAPAGEQKIENEE